MAPLWVDLWKEFSRSRKGFEFDFGFGFVLILVLVLVEPDGARGKGAAFEPPCLAPRLRSLPRSRAGVRKRCFPHPILRNCSKSLCLACCMRRAASVSLMSPAMRSSVATMRPGRRYCWGLGSFNSVSRGVW